MQLCIWRHAGFPHDCVSTCCLPIVDSWVLFNQEAIAKPDVVMHIYNTSAEEAETGGLQVRGEPGLQNETLSKIKWVRRGLWPVHLGALLCKAPLLLYSGGECLTPPPTSCAVQAYPTQPLASPCIPCLYLLPLCSAMPPDYHSHPIYSWGEIVTVPVRQHCT